jgi:serine/threonine-protein kinase HipA
MTGNDRTLKVWLGGNIIAQIVLSNDVIKLNYTDDWRQQGFSLTPHLPLNSNIPTINVQRFFRNLLPEGAGLDELVLTLQLSTTNTFGLIRAIGNDLPGALVVSGEQKVEDSYFRKIPDEELIQRLNQKETVGLVMWDKKPRLSVAGIQNKINVMINNNNQLGFAEGLLCSTHILKFETKKQIHLVINEYFTMQLARYCGLEVAKVELKQFGVHRALLVERFDRKKISDEEVKRRHLIDGCQALNLSPDYKYERNFGSGRDVENIREGASLPKLFKFASHCLNPAETKLKLLDWVLFNCLIFNFDAHGKNISFFVNAKGISLAPFYDLVNIAMYPHYEQDMAMALGDEFDGHAIHAYQLADFADTCNMSRRLVVRRIKRMINKILSYFKNEITGFSNLEQSYLKKYKKQVTMRCRHLLQESNLIQAIEL